MIVEFNAILGRLLRQNGFKLSSLTLPNKKTAQEASGFLRGFDKHGNRQNPAGLGGAKS